MKSTLEKLLMLALLGFITLFVFGMSGAGLSQSSYPAFITPLWNILAALLIVSFVITIYATLKNHNTTTISWYKKIIFLPWSLFACIALLVGVSTILELLTSLFG